MEVLIFIGLVLAIILALGEILVSAGAYVVVFIIVILSMLLKGKE